VVRFITDHPENIPKNMPMNNGDTPINTVQMEGLPPLLKSMTRVAESTTNVKNVATIRYANDM
jgi:hypothetical protein